MFGENNVAWCCENKVGWFCENNVAWFCENNVEWFCDNHIRWFGENKVGWFDSITSGCFAVRGSESAFAPPPQERHSRRKRQARVLPAARTRLRHHRVTFESPSHVCVLMTRLGTYVPQPGHPQTDFVAAGNRVKVTMSHRHTQQMKQLLTR